MHIFDEAGVCAWVALGAAVLSVVFTWVQPRRMHLGWALVCLPLACGVVGYLLGMRAMEHAIAVVEPSMRDILREAGTKEAFENIVVGGGLCAIAACVRLVKTEGRPSA